MCASSYEVVGALQSVSVCCPFSARLHGGSSSKGAGGLPLLSKLGEPGEEEGHYTEEEGHCTEKEGHRSEDMPLSSSGDMSNASQDISHEEDEMVRE